MHCQYTDRASLPAREQQPPDGPKDSLTPRALSATEIPTTIGVYRQAAANALRAGFDGLEIHAQISHLVAQFLNPRLNQRTDAYGGSSEKRAQFLLDVVDAVSSVWGSDRIGIKLSPYWNHEPAFTADAETLAEYDQLLERLNDSNLAYLHLLGPEPDTGTDTLTTFTRYRAHYRGAVIANLGFTQASGNELLERQLADAVSFGAPFIANPDLVDRFTHDHPLAADNRDTHFAGGAQGYTDYATVIGSPPRSASSGWGVARTVAALPSVGDVPQPSAGVPQRVDVLLRLTAARTTPRSARPQGAACRRHLVHAVAVRPVDGAALAVAHVPRELVAGFLHGELSVHLAPVGVVHRVDIDGLVRRAHCSRATVYRHVGSKSAIIEAVLTASSTNVTSTVRAATAGLSRKNLHRLPERGIACDEASHVGMPADM